MRGFAFPALRCRDMKFIDEVKIRVKAGDGGRGCVSFRREKFVARGGPNGGNGGQGGDVIAVADTQLVTLLDLRYQREYRAGRGEHGRGKDQQGHRGEDKVITVPAGTVIRDAVTGEVLADLRLSGERVVVAAGGKGGKGNAYFVSSTNRSPRYAQAGLPGEEKGLDIELRLLAEVGIIGLPNAGKSTLIGAISAARPKIADYPFTTMVPNLGVVSYEEGKTYVVADVPGLIKGAHRGEGLGHKFLRHVSRTSVLIHLIDGSKIERDDPLAQWSIVNQELELYDPGMAEKLQIVVVNKIDLPESRGKIQLFKRSFTAYTMPLCAVSAVTGEGLQKLKRLIGEKLDTVKTGKGAPYVAAGL